jgi:hypothetical protein
MDGGWRILDCFPKPSDDDTESPSQSEEEPDLQEPRNLFENTSQENDDEDDDPAAQPLEQIYGGEDSIASESELMTLNEISKDRFVDTNCDSDRKNSKVNTNPSYRKLS